MLDVIIPTWSGDREQARLLLRSMDTFVDPGVVRSLNLLAVDVRARSREIETLRTHKFQSRTTYLDAPDLGIENRPTNATIGQYGWYLQMVAKLLFARVAKSEFYLALDSKNIVVDAVRLSDFVRDNKAASALEDVAIHRHWWRNTVSLLKHGAFNTRSGRLALSAATPVLLHRPTVIAMLSWLEKEYGRSVESLYLDRRSNVADARTEFCSYFVYLDREGLYRRHHFRSNRLHDTKSMVWAGQSARVRQRQLMRLLVGRHSGLFSGIHRRIWECLSTDVKEHLIARASGQFEMRDLLSP